MNIDYDKLDTVNKLCEKLADLLEHIRISTSVSYTKDRMLSEFYCIKINYSQEYNCNNIEELIEKLVEIINKKSKITYKVGQEVWILNDKNIPKKHIIEQVDEFSIEKYTIDDNNDWYQEEQLYPSLEKLIEAQIEYWTSLKIQEKLARENDISKIFSLRSQLPFRPSCCMDKK